MRILVTGGAGFIGSHLTDRFLDEGHDVICMENLLTGRAANHAAPDNHHRGFARQLAWATAQRASTHAAKRGARKPH